MAPIPYSIFPRAIRHYHSSGGADGGGGGGGIGGGVIAAIIALMIIVFVCVYVREHNKAKRIRTETGAPINHGKCFKKAILIALTLGLVSLLCAECCGLGDDNNNENAVGGGGGGVPQMDQSGGAFVQQPMPSYQPQMDWTPVNDAAADPVQG